MSSDGLDRYFSIVALFIIFRETIEASLIVSVLLQFLSRSFPQLRKQVWWGVGCGAALSILFGVIFISVFYVTKENVFTGTNKSIFAGSICWFAGTLITILAFAMLRYKGWEEKIQRKLEERAKQELERLEGKEPPPLTRMQAAKARVTECITRFTQPIVYAASACWTCTSTAAGTCWAASTGGCVRAWDTARQKLPCERCRKPRSPPQPIKSDLLGENYDLVSNSHGKGIFMIVFVTVLREGIESVIFLAGVGNAKPSSLPLPGLVGFACGVAAGMFLYYSGRQVKDLKWFIILMSVILFFIAGGQFLLGTDFLTTGGLFGYCSPWVNQRPWAMQPLAVYTCCPKSHEFFSLMRAIFGYQDKPTFIEVMVYSGYWLLVFSAAAYKLWNGSLFDADYKHKREVAKAARLKAKQETQLELVVSSEEAAQLAKKAAQETASSNPESESRSNSGSGVEEDPPANASNPLLALARHVVAPQAVPQVSTAPASSPDLTSPATLEVLTAPVQHKM
ncbi:iron permease FTR1 family-domain-containing protein [Haematococcus lacustris]